MPGLVTKSAVQERQEQRLETRTSVERNVGFIIVTTAVVALAVLGATVVYARDHTQDKYSLKTTSGIAFSDFRGYEDWAVVSSARTDAVLKVIVGNQTMINAYKAGVPGDGQAFVMEKDSKRFPKSGGWGYAVFNYDAASDKFTADPSPADCGNTCHTAVKAKDYIFHPYQKR